MQIKNLKSIVLSDVEIIGYNPLDNTESNESIITCDNENYIIVKLTYDKNVNKAVLRLYTVTCNGSFKVCSLVDPCILLRLLLAILIYLSIIKMIYEK